MTNFEKKIKFLLVFVFIFIFSIFLWESFSNFFWSVEISSDPNITTEISEISKNLLNQQDLMGQVVITGLENQNLSSKIGLVNGEGDLEDISGKSNELGGGGKIYSEWWKFVLGIEENPSFRPMSQWIKIPVPPFIYGDSFNFLNMKRLVPVDVVAPASTWAEAPVWAWVSAQADAQAEAIAEAQVWAQVWAEAPTWAEAIAEAQVEAEVAAIAQVQAQAPAPAWAIAQAWAQTWAIAPAKAIAQVQAQAPVPTWVEAEVEALAWAEAEVEAEAKAQAEAEAIAKAKAKAKAPVLVSSIAKGDLIEKIELLTNIEKIKVEVMVRKNI